MSLGTRYVNLSCHNHPVGFKVIERLGIRVQRKLVANAWRTKHLLQQMGAIRYDIVKPAEVP